MTASQGLGPAIPRRRFGAELRRLRTERGMLLGQVANELLISTSKLSRLEKGQGVPQDRDVRDLLNYYGVAGTTLGERMKRWAREARETPWWHEMIDFVPSGLHQYLQYETAAAEIRGYVDHFVPSLLQVEDYARALSRALYPEMREVDRLVEVTLRRQEVLSRSDYPVSLDVIMDESVFHRTVGSAAVMRQQLSALADAAALPNVTLRIFPFSAGPHPVMIEGVFTLFHFRRALDQDVVNIEGRDSNTYLDDPEAVAVYRLYLDELRHCARVPDASADFIKQMSQSY